MTTTIYKDAVTNLSIINGAPPVNQTALVATLTAQVAALTIERDALAAKLAALPVVPPVQPVVQPLWSAGMEGGNLKEWYTPALVEGLDVPNSGGGEYNTGDGNTTASTEQHRTGNWSMKMTIGGGASSGTRMTRWNETTTPQDRYYSVWYFIPQIYTPQVGGWLSWWNWKSANATKNDPFFILGPSIVSGAMRLGLGWWNGLTIEGPKLGQSGGRQWVSQINIPVAKWFNLEARLKAAGDFTGSLQVWQDGVEIFNLTDIRTRYPDGNMMWAVNNYGENILPRPVVIYVDDVAISTVRIGGNP